MINRVKAYIRLLRIRRIIDRIMIKEWEEFLFYIKSAKRDYKGGACDDNRDNANPET